MLDPKTHMEITINGASDDLVEVAVNGTAVEEYDAYDKPVAVQLTAPNGETLDVLAQFGRRASNLDWTLAVRAANGYPSWPIRFHERADREGDPAVTLTVPVGTTFDTTDV